MPQEVPCNLCGSRRLAVRNEKMSFLGLPEGLGIVECTRCGLTFMSPRPTQEEYIRFYETAGIYSVDSYSQRAERRTEFYHRRLGAIERERRAKGKFLEIGCATGAFLHLAQEAGWRVTGTELSKRLREHAMQRLGLDVRCGPSLAACGFPSGEFDVIYSAHVFEHLLDPMATLVEVRRIIKPSGLLVLEVPYQFHSLRDRLRRRLIALTGRTGQGRFYSPVFSAVHHVYFFSPRTLSAMVNKAGFSVLRMRTYEKHHRQVIGDAPLGGYWLAEWMHRTGAVFGIGPIILLMATAA